MKGKEIFLALLKILDCAPGERVLIDKLKALELQGKTLYNLSVPFSFVIYGDGVEVPFTLNLEMGNVPKRVVSILTAKNPIVNECEFISVGNKMPELTIKIKIEK